MPVVVIAIARRRDDGRLRPRCRSRIVVIEAMAPTARGERRDDGDRSQARPRATHGGEREPPRSIRRLRPWANGIVRATMEHDGGNAKRRAIAELEKTGVRLKLLKFARWRTGSDADAADLLQSALAKVFDPNDSPWDPTKGASFFLHVGSIVNGLAANARRSWQAQHEVLEAGLARDHDTVDGA